MLLGAPMSFAATRSRPGVSITILSVARPIRPSPLMATLAMACFTANWPRLRRALESRDAVSCARAIRPLHRATRNEPLFRVVLLRDIGLEIRNETAGFQNERRSLPACCRAAHSSSFQPARLRPGGRSLACIYHLHFRRQCRLLHPLFTGVQRVGQGVRAEYPHVN